MRIVLKSLIFKDFPAFLTIPSLCLRVWASKSTFSSWHFWHYRVCVFGFEYKNHKFIPNLLFFHIILSKITNFLMSGILVRIMVGMLVRMLVVVYASNVDHTDTALRSTVELRQQRRPYWGSSIKLYGLANLFQHTEVARRSTVELRQQCRHPWQPPYHAKTHPQNFLEILDFEWFSGRKRWFRCSDSKTQARKCQKCWEILENQWFQDDSHGYLWICMKKNILSSQNIRG